MSEYNTDSDGTAMSQAESMAQKIKADMDSKLTVDQMANISKSSDQHATAYQNLKDDSIYRMPHAGEIWIHHSNKAVRILLVTNRASSPLDRDKYPITVCYRTADGSDFSRPLWYFRKSYRYSTL